jgi:hypothetical protein
VELFKAFTDALSIRFIDYLGGANYDRKAIGGDKSIQSTTGPGLTDGIPLHAEKHFMANPPNVICFYCHQPAEAGGETLLCDGVDLYAQLPKPIQDLFRTNRIVYRRVHADGVWQKVYGCGTVAEVEQLCKMNGVQFAMDPTERSVTTEYRCSAVVGDAEGRPAFANNVLPFALSEWSGKVQSRSVVRFEDGSRIPMEVVLTIASIADRLACQTLMRPNDVMLVDNSTILHGRRPFTGENRCILFRVGDLP